MTKVYKVEILIIDHDDLGPEGVTDVLQHSRYPNRCISPRVVSVVTRRVEWSGDHPLNGLVTRQEAYERLFAKAEK